MMIDSLEPRRLLSATRTRSPDGDTLEISGTARPDVILTRLIGKSIVVSLNTVISRFPRAGVKNITISGGLGDDFLSNGAGEIRDAQQLGQHVTGVVEAQCLVEIRHQQIVFGQWGTHVSIPCSGAASRSR